MSINIDNDTDNDLFALNAFTMNGSGKPVNNKRNKKETKQSTFKHEKVNSNELIIRSNGDNVF